MLGHTRLELIPQGSLEPIYCLFILLALKLLHSLLKQKSSCYLVSYMAKVSDNSPYLKASKEIAMKISNMRSLKRIRFLRWGKRIASSGAVVTLGSVKRRVPVEYCQVSYVLRQLFWRLKSQWKQVLKWQRSSVQYSYDPHSYSQNFDDGFYHDHLSPHAPR